MRIHKMLKALAGARDEGTYIEAIEAAQRAHAMCRSASAEATADLATKFDALKAGEATITAAMVDDGMPYDDAVLDSLKEEMLRAQRKEHVCNSAVLQALHNVELAKAAYKEFGIKTAGDEALRAIASLAKLAGPLAIQYRLAEAAVERARQVGAGVADYLPLIADFLGWAERQAAEAATPPRAEVDKMHVVKFLSSNDGYIVGDTAGFSIPFCVTLVASGKAEWAHPDPRQAPLVAAELARRAIADKPRYFESGAIIGAPQPHYIADRDSRPSSEVGPALGHEAA